MPRQPRLDIEGEFHHIINRGMERRTIFKHQTDFQSFREYLDVLIKEEGHQCYGWVLMPNHYHLLIERGRQPLSRLMNRLQTYYAGYFNRRYRRSGHLFQNRYTAILCDKESYFLELIAYLHLNPLRGGLVKNIQELSQYPWSSHRAILGLEEKHGDAMDDILRRFGERAGSARKKYLKYLEDKYKEKQNLSGGGLIRSAGGLKIVLARKKNDQELSDTRILGDGAFVEKVIEQVDEEVQLVAKSVDKEEILVEAGKVLGVSLHELTRRGKSSSRVAQARALIIYISVEYQEAKRIEWAKQFRISQPAVSRLYDAGMRLSRANKDIFKKLKKII